MLTVLVMAEYSIGLRLSSTLLERIHQHCLLSNESRNKWLLRAARMMLKRGYPIRAKTTARELLIGKQPITFRVDPLTLELIDEACDEDDLTRTVWIMDAILSRLAKQPISKLRQK